MTQLIARRLIRVLGVNVAEYAVIERTRHGRVAGIVTISYLWDAGPRELERRPELIDLRQ